MRRRRRPRPQSEPRPRAGTGASVRTLSHRPIRCASAQTRRAVPPAAQSGPNLSARGVRHCAPPPSPPADSLRRPLKSRPPSSALLPRSAGRRRHGRRRHAPLCSFWSATAHGPSVRAALPVPSGPQPRMDHARLQHCRSPGRAVALPASKRNRQRLCGPLG